MSSFNNSGIDTVANEYCIWKQRFSFDTYLSTDTFDNPYWHILKNVYYDADILAIDQYRVNKLVYLPLFSQTESGIDTFAWVKEYFSPPLE